MISLQCSDRGEGWGGWVVVGGSVRAELSVIAAF